MKPSALAFPGHKINEYLLVLSPQPTLRNKLLAVKEEYSHACQAPYAHCYEPRITLAAFHQYAMKEERLVNKLKATGMEQQPITVLFNNYGCLPHHTIFINIVSNEPVLQLVKAIREHHELMALNKLNRPQFNDNLQMTIGWNLSKEQFDKQWPHYNNRSCNAELIADNMRLLRRPAGMDAAYQLVHKIEFLHQPVEASLGKLLINT